MFNTLIFDLDGTLVDSLEDLADTTNQLLKEDHLPLHELKEYKLFVGNGVDKLIERALPENKKDEVKSYRKRFDEYYKDNCLNHTKPYPQINELIDLLYKEGYKLAVVTNKPKGNAVKIVNTLFPNRFSYVFGNTPYQPKKPHPCLTQLAMQLLDASQNEVLYIGDSNIDIETAKNAHVKSVGCTWGFRGKKELEAAKANYIVENPMEIMEILK